jgi:lipopolysaccharide export system permease protein
MTQSPRLHLPRFGISVMDRYILMELIMPFLFGVVAFSSIGVAIGVLFDLVRRITESGLPLGIAAQIFFLKLPYFVSLALPLSMLLACLMVYGRLAGDSELIALRSCGVSIYRLIVPALAMSLVLTGLTFAFNEAIVPAANRQANQIMDRALNQKEPSFRERDIVYQEFRDQKLPNGDRERLLSRMFYARQFDGKKMKGLTILDFSQTGLNQIIVAESALWNTDEKTWDFRNGTIYVIAPDGSYRNIVRFDNQKLQLPRTPLDIAETNLDPMEMNISQIREYLALVGQTGDEKTVRRLKLRIDQKIAFPFACLMFGLVGAALGTRPQRTSRAAGFGLSLVLIVSYHLFVGICEALYGFGILSAFFAGWMPVLLGLVAGLLILFGRQ